MEQEQKIVYLIALFYWKDGKLEKGYLSKEYYDFLNLDRDMDETAPGLITDSPNRAAAFTSERYAKVWLSDVQVMSEEQQVMSLSVQKWKKTTRWEYMEGWL